MKLRSKVMAGRGRLVLLLAGTLLVAACGGSSEPSANSRIPAVVLMASAPNSLDPAVGDNREAFAADWLAYTPLLTYAHANGTRGTELVPALAASLPSISDGGTVYTFTLISGLRYSSGRPLQASDFAWTAERAIKLWPEAGKLFTSHIVGAGAFAAGRAKTIRGIVTNDATGQITFHLTAPYGAIEDVLALPALAPVPAGTPFTDLRTAPPPGIGPYTIANVIPGSSFSLIRTPAWKREGVLAVPAGHLDIDVRITGDAAQNARAVLHNTADVLDFSDQIPLPLLDQIRQQASRRYSARTTTATDLVFLDATRKPFSSPLAREAVRDGLDEMKMASLAPGRLQSGCYVLPPSVLGHPPNPCPGAGNLARAKALVARSGMTGTQVAVSSEPAAPVSRWMTYYISLLDEIGFKAHLADGVGAGHSQTGFSGLEDTLPNPLYLYEQLLGGTRPTVDDPYVTTTVKALSGIPGSTVGGAAAFWSQLDRYVADQAYVVAFGYPTFPEFVSTRMDFGAAVFSPVAGVDWSSLRRK